MAKLIGNINPHNLLKKDMLELLTGRCKHSHLYIEHPSCWRKEKGRPPKIGYFDIETGGFNANADIILCYSIKTRDKDEILNARITKNDINTEIFDKRIIKQLIKDLLKYDVIVTYYGTRFDIPFSRTRALGWRLSFPVFGMVKHKDVYYMVKNKLKLTSRSLATACELLGIRGKNHIKWRIWIKAKHGNEKALEYVQNHCNIDVRILEGAHKKLEVFVKDTKKSM